MIELPLQSLAELPLPQTAQSLAVVCVVLALFWSCLPLRKATVQVPVVSSDCETEDNDVDEILRALGAPDYPHEEGTMVPPMGISFGNSAPAPFDNEFATGRFLSLHRATHSKTLDKSGNYSYGKYFLGKKRLWEARIQFTLKQPIGQELFFGVEIEDYVPMSAATKTCQSMLVRLLKGVVGDQIYHSPGDDPEIVSDNIEDPIFAMPMWAFDQFMVTPEGVMPPDLSDLAVSSMGCKRYKRVSEFKKEMAAVKFVVGPTYTFCFWGISQFLDKLNWKVRVPFMRPFDLDLFVGSPPVHVIIYFLTNREGEENETRHVSSRKNYIFNVAFWSSRRRPPSKRLESCLGDFKEALAASRANDVNGLHLRTERSSSSRFFACCGSR